MRLICFPSVGAGPSAFRGWDAFLPMSIDVVPAQLAGRGRRASEPALRDMASVVADLFSSLELADAPDPFALFGHSMGALIAFEVARHLRHAGGPAPVGLVVSGHRAPHPAADDVPLSSLDDEAFVAVVKDLGGTPEEVLADPDLLRYLLPTMRADCEVVDTYELAAEAPLDVPLLALGGTADPTVSEEQLRAWSEHTTSDFACELHPGEHFFLNDHLPEVLRTIGDFLVRHLAAVTPSAPG